MMFRFIFCGLIITGCASGPKPSEIEARERQGKENVIRSTFPYDCVKQQDGYAGLVIVSLPDNYGIRSYFKGDADQKLSACIDDPKYQVFEKQLATAIETPFSVVDFKRERDIAEAALREAGIEAYGYVHPYGHADNFPEREGEIFEGHVLISVEKDDVSRAEIALAPLALETVYVREIIYEEVILTSFSATP